MTTPVETEFTGWRSFLWPIHRWEIKKFLPLLLIFTLICFNYSILKAAKDALVVTAPGSGAEALPFIKVWLILPMALLVTYLFTRLFNRYSQEKVFYIMIGGFLSFFFIFALVLYPLRDAIHPHGVADRLQMYLPQGFQGLISIFRNWSFSLFYVMSELWGTAIMSVLFWGFTNELASVKEAKRYYGILTVGANIATTAAGLITVRLSTQMFDLSFLFGEDRWGQSLGLVTTSVIAAGLLTMGIFRWYHLHVINKDPKMKQIQIKHHEQKKKMKMGMRKNFSYLAKSKYLICIAIIVLGFNVAINMIEIIWKDQIKALYPDPNMFQAYMGNVLTATGIVSTFIALFLCSNIIRRLGWTFSALITPIALLITGIFFFTMILFKESSALSTWTAALSLTPLALGVLFGTIQNVLSRACKYTLFDATKEIAFIPLNAESKIKGKAAIDGVGSRLGKSGGSLVHQGLLMVFGSVSLSAPYVGLFLLVVAFGWITAAKSLGRQFNRLTTQDEKLTIPEEERRTVMRPAAVVAIFAPTVKMP